MSRSIRRRSFAIASGILALAACHSATSAQYCGGTLEYVVRDQKDLLIDARSVEVVSRGFPSDEVYISTPHPALKDEYKRRKMRGDKGISASQIPQAELDSAKSYQRPSNVERLHLATFAIRMGCGMRQLELSLKYRGDVMNLRFKNISEMNALLDAVPFQAGTYEADFEGLFNGLPTDKTKFNLEGLRSGDEIFLPWHARGGVLISASNWRKVR